MRYLLLAVSATVMVCGGCSDDTDSGACDKGEFDGNFWIGTQADVAVIAGYTSVSGDLTINCPLCTNLSELACLTTVGRDLVVGGNHTLANLDGLGAITSVGGCLQIGSSVLEGNDTIVNLDELSAITSVGGGLAIQYNNAITNLDGLSGITSMGDFLNITGNTSLTTRDGLSPFTEVCGGLRIK
jgi:hypothetical protein